MRSAIIGCGRRALSVFVALAFFSLGGPADAMDASASNSSYYRKPDQVAKVSDPMMGTWRQDWSKATVNGVVRNAAQLGKSDEWLQATPLGLNGIMVDAEITRPDGTVYRQLYNGPFDGSPIPIVGDGNAVTATMTRPDLLHMIVTSRDKDGNVTRTRTFEVSSDGMIKIRHMESVDATGRKTESEFYLYRQ
jgi:hypothetical protein